MNNRLEVQDCIMYDHNVHAVNRKPLHYLIHKWHFKILENQNKDKQIVHRQALLQNIPEMIHDIHYGGYHSSLMVQTGKCKTRYQTKTSKKIAILDHTQQKQLQKLKFKMQNICSEKMLLKETTQNQLVSPTASFQELHTIFLSILHCHQYRLIKRVP